MSLQGRSAYRLIADSPADAMAVNCRFAAIMNGEFTLQPEAFVHTRYYEWNTLQLQLLTDFFSRPAYLKSKQGVIEATDNFCAPSGSGWYYCLITRKDAAVARRRRFHSFAPQQPLQLQEQNYHLHRLRSCLITVTVVSKLRVKKCSTGPHSCVHEVNMEKHWSAVCALLLALGVCVHLDTAEADHSLTAKSGVCPRRRWGSGLCAEFCFKDSDCPNDEKCCHNGCGHECIAPYTGDPHVCRVLLSRRPVSRRGEVLQDDLRPRLQRALLRGQPITPPFS
ncbi:hypothetical protein F2P81_011731 [Scophthalmus maximus]|uniref:WAP domain-containing protein n=1 Tax=Scophthalmus maximus TaxID=52904 RepID=A0A6A4SUR5_SCOMX|nr:hypothetical protein F2P81_011731 [Scophthalmus maximus]